MADPPPPYYPPTVTEKAGFYPPQPQPAAVYLPQQPPYYPPTEKTGFYPPQPQPATFYPPPQYPTQQVATVVVTQPVVTPTVVFRDRPVVVTDSNGQQVTTQLEYRSGALTWLMCCIIFWLLGLWCCAFIPFCIDATKDVYHITPTDGKVVGVFRRL